MKCCFKECSSSDNQNLSLLTVGLLDDTFCRLYAHDQCFESKCHPNVSFDSPKEHGHIPKNAKCIFCGEKLPGIGIHPYTFDFGNFVPPHRYWAHSHCMKNMVNLDTND